MSMNLHCDKVELYQTPTWVTYSCYYKEIIEKGKVKQVEEDWPNIRYKYSCWVKDMYYNKPNWNIVVEKHVAELYSYKSLRFYIN